jgi:hypothetical protein
VRCIVVVLDFFLNQNKASSLMISVTAVPVPRRASLGTEWFILWWEDVALTSRPVLAAQFRHPERKLYLRPKVSCGRPSQKGGRS